MQLTLGAQFAWEFDAQFGGNIHLFQKRYS